MSGLVWIQTVCKGWQQTTLGDKELKAKACDLCNKKFMRKENFLNHKTIEDIHIERTVKHITSPHNVLFYDRPELFLLVDLWGGVGLISDLGSGERKKKF